MSDDPRFEREARRWLELGPTEAPERALSQVLLVIATTPQERGRRAPWRNMTMINLLRVAAVLAVSFALVAGPVRWWVEGSSPGPGAISSPSPAPLPPTACPSGGPLPSGTLTTIAGTGAKGSTGDGGPALAATVDPGQGIAVDDQGNVYFADAGGSVRRIRTDGIIEAFATGFDSPSGVAFDAAGDLYVTDGYTTIKKVDRNGVVTTVAGTGVSGYSGNEGPATEAEVQPVQVAVGPAGDLYFDDLNNFRRIDPAGIIHAFAGTTDPGFDGDGGPAADARFGQAVNRRWRPCRTAACTWATRATSASDVWTRPASSTPWWVTGHRGGQGMTALPSTPQVTSSPFGMSSDPAGNVYFTDWQASRVRRIDPDGIITTVAGPVVAGSPDCGPANSAYLSAPVAVAWHEGALFIVEAGSKTRIRMVVP